MSQWEGWHFISRCCKSPCSVMRCYLGLLCTIEDSAVIVRLNDVVLHKNHSPLGLRTQPAAAEWAKHRMCAVQNWLLPPQWLCWVLEGTPCLWRFWMLRHVPVLPGPHALGLRGNIAPFALLAGWSAAIVASWGGWWLWAFPLGIQIRTDRSWWSPLLQLCGAGALPVPSTHWTGRGASPRSGIGDAR